MFSEDPWAAYHPPTQDAGEFLPFSGLEDPPAVRLLSDAALLCMATDDYDRLCTSYPIEQVAAWQHHIQARLDKLCALCGVNKICSSGASFVVSAERREADAGEGEEEEEDGLPPAELLLRFARAATLVCREFNSPGGVPVSARFGLHIGPLAEGIIGLASLRYSVFGLTAMEAQRLLDTCPPASLQMSQAAHLSLQGGTVATPAPALARVPNVPAPAPSSTSSRTPSLAAALAAAPMPPPLRQQGGRWYTGDRGGGRSAAGAAGPSPPPVLVPARVMLEQLRGDVRLQAVMRQLREEFGGEASYDDSAGSAGADGIDSLGGMGGVDGGGACPTHGWALEFAVPDVERRFVQDGAAQFRMWRALALSAMVLATVVAGEVGASWAYSQAEHGASWPHAPAARMRQLLLPLLLPVTTAAALCPALYRAHHQAAGCYCIVLGVMGTTLCISHGAAGGGWLCGGNGGGGTGDVVGSAADYVFDCVLYVYYIVAGGVGAGIGGAADFNCWPGAVASAAGCVAGGVAAAAEDAACNPLAPVVVLVQAVQLNCLPLLAGVRFRYQVQLYAMLGPAMLVALAQQQLQCGAGTRASSPLTTAGDLAVALAPHALLALLLPCLVGYWLERGRRRRWWLQMQGGNGGG